MSSGQPLGVEGWSSSEYIYIYVYLLIMICGWLLLVIVKITLINPQRACTERVTVVILCVCVCMYVCVCLSAHAILAVRAIKSVTKDTVVLNVTFAAIL